MRRSAEIEEKEKEIKQAMKNATKADRRDEACFYEGVLLALDWVRDKGGRNTPIVFLK